MKTKSILLLICIAMLTSCAGKFGVMKRRYNKGFYVSVAGDRKTVAKHERSEKAHTNELKNEQAATIIVDERAAKNASATGITPTSKVRSARNRGEHRPKVYASAAVNIAPSAQVIKSLPQLIPSKKTGIEGRSGDSDTNTILLVILAIFIPPLAVYLRDNAVSKWFWITLILSLVGLLGILNSIAWAAWVAAVIIAILYVLGNIG